MGILTRPATGRAALAALMLLAAAPRLRAADAPAAAPAAPAAAATAPASTAPAPKDAAPGDDGSFLSGIRKVGVMSGEAYVCAADADRDQIGKSALDLATAIATHFGLRLAFIYSGAFGYGTGHSFDHATCPATLDSFHALEKKYLSK